MTDVIAQPCVDVKDKACIDECPVDCIYEGERSLYIHPAECVDCDELGSPQGAAALGNLHRDHPVVVGAPLAV
jgi:hypothetical protein